MKTEETVSLTFCILINEIPRSIEYSHNDFGYTSTNKIDLEFGSFFINACNVKHSSLYLVENTGENIKLEIIGGFLSVNHDNELILDIITNSPFCIDQTEDRLSDVKLEGFHIVFADGHFGTQESINLRQSYFINPCNVKIEVYYE